MSISVTTRRMSALVLTSRRNTQGACLLLLVCTFACLLIGCSGSGDRMRQQLQQLQARNQSDSLMTDDSLATALCTWFDSHGTPNERMLAHYLMGRTWADKGEAPQALEEYHTAAECADTTAADCDYELLTKIDLHLGTTFFQKQLFIQALHSFQDASQYADKANSTKLDIYAQEQVSRCYYAMNNIDKALMTLKSVQKNYLKSKDTLSANICSATIAFYLISTGRDEEARPQLNLFEKAIASSDELLDEHEDWKLFHYHKGLFFLHVRETDSAKSCFYTLLKQARSINNKVGAYNGLFQLYKTIGNIDSVAKYASLRTQINDSTYNLSLSSLISQQEAQYNYSRLQNLANKKSIEANENRLNFQFLAILFILVLFVVSLLLYRRNLLIQRLKAKHATNMLAYSNIKSQLKDIDLQNTNNIEKRNELENELAFLKDKIKEMEKEIPHPDRWNIENNLLETDIICNIKRKSAKGNMISSQEWNDLRQLMNIYLPDFMESLDGYDYKPNLKETQICVLLKLRFGLSEISNLINMSYSSLGNCRKRLLLKLFGITGSAKDFDERIITMS